MKILLLAPQPFYQERGTPIAVDLVLKTLSQRGDQIDVFTYHLGRDMKYPGVTIHRIPNIPLIREVPPGFSFRKVLCDLFLFLIVFPRLFKHSYDIVHAVEESVFIAMVLKFLFGVPYVYDMDSSLSQQMLDRYPHLFRPVISLLSRLEGLAIRNALAVVPVCEALSRDIQRHSPGKVIILHDVSLLTPAHQPPSEELRQSLPVQGPLMMYVGNLEGYQGIDLLLESFALALRRKGLATLVIIGGNEADIRFYREQARRLGIDRQVHFLGPKPLDRLADYLAQADILVSPRIKGMNTPMKVYSYLDSGRAVLATDLPTHTQVLNSKVAYLANPTPRDFSDGVLQLVRDKELRQRLGQAGKRLVEEHHTIQAFNDSLNSLYEWLSAHSEHKNHQVDLSAPAGGGSGTPTKKELYG